MQEEIGMAAGAIWQTLNGLGELSLTKLKKQVKAKDPTFDWAVGWLAREGKVVITRKKKGSFRIRLKEQEAKSVGAS